MVIITPHLQPLSFLQLRVQCVGSFQLFIYYLRVLSTLNLQVICFPHNLSMADNWEMKYNWIKCYWFKHWFFFFGQRYIILNTLIYSKLHLKNPGIKVTLRYKKPWFGKLELISNPDSLWAFYFRRSCFQSYLIISIMEIKIQED